MRGLLPLLCAGGVAAVLSCSDDQQSTEGSGAGASTSNGSSSSGGLVGGAGGAFPSSGSGSTSVSSYSTGVGPPPTEIAECQAHVYQCGDLLDNDGDGLIDYQDPDCLGPCDNTEDSLHGGIPGQNEAPCKQDCYWDQDGGPGNDGCYWDHRCDFHSVDPNYYPEPWLGNMCEFEGLDYNITPVMKTCGELDMEQSDVCHDFCGPLTPNGCDCFGCCELPANSGSYVWLGSLGVNEDTVCTLDKIGDPTVCHPCDPVDSCLNPCDPCEICLGKPLPGPECGNGTGGNGAGGGPGQQCDLGVQPCGLPNQPLCPSGYYCITGCCIAEPD